MARLRDSESVNNDDRSTILRDSSRAPSTNHRNSHAANSASPSPSAGSDKENRSSRQASKRQSMGPPPLPTPQSGNHAQANKRRRTGDAPQEMQSQRSAREGSAAVYDPNQDVQERQTLRKDLRDLNVSASDNRNDWLRQGDTGLQKAVDDAEHIWGKVKQTSDATIDSRFQVTASDLASKKVAQASLGDGSTGVDIDDFVSKCIAFMRRGDEHEESQPYQTQHSSSTQRRRVARTRNEQESDDEMEINDNAMNWAWLGSRACFAVTTRPPVPSFLLGPLSVQKRVRETTQRRARAERVNPENAVRPRELQVEDLQRQEDKSLTSMCKKIHSQLGTIMYEVEQAEENEATEEELDALCVKNHIKDNGGVSMFQFAFDPESFGQTVENMFYVSFLIKEGTVGIEFDEECQPTLHYRDRNAIEDDSAAAQQAARSQNKFQSVLAIDYADWRAACETFDIKQSLIRHRAEEEEQSASVGTTAWYG